MSAGFSAFDRAMMQRALALAGRGAYTTRPNPMVGCVLVQGEHIIGEGWHRRKGGAHAEIFALHEAGEAARGATAYVTLEPCAHTGSTGPCADALIAAGVTRVVAAMRDPFPQVAGQGFAWLRAAGIAVEVGLEEAAARWLNRGYLSRIERGRPWLRLKQGASLDGRTALAGGESKWITSAESRADVQRYRARAGALMTGAATVMADDPHFTVRLPEGEDVLPPLRVVLDARLESLAARHIRSADAPTLYCHADTLTPPALADVEWLATPLKDGRLDVGFILAALAARGIHEVQVEAGSRLAGTLLREGWIDELLLYLAPCVLGDDARGLFAGLGLTALAGAPRFALHDSTPMGDDLRLTLLPQPAAA